jgi:predicted nucleic acid-binding protein
MSDRILIDTSAWIVSFKKTGNESLKQKVLETLSFFSAATTPVIVLELLQGCRDKKEYEAMKSRMEALEMLPVNEAVWEAAYRAGYDLRRKGITVPTIDILILSIAKVHNCSLLHHDKHFKLVAKHLGVIALDYIGE